MNQFIRRSLAAALVAVGVSATVACAPQSRGEEDRHLTLSGSLGFLMNPFEGGALKEWASMAVYEPLWVKLGDTEYQPWLAKEYEVSEDGLTMSITLRDDVDFSDGTHLTAEAVETYLDRLFASDGYLSKSVVVDQFHSEVTATGEYTLEISSDLRMGFEWMHHLSETVIVSPEALDDTAALTDSPVGTGPYLIDEREVDVSLSFVRNPGYWSPETYPYDTITIVAYEDEIAALNALKTGQVDVIGLSVSLATEAENSGFALHRAHGARTLAGLFIIDRAGAIQPALGDLRVRQAINMAFDREAINESLNLGYGTVSSQPFAEGESFYVDGADDRYPYDPERARELLAEAGYPDGFDVVIPATPGLTGAIEPLLQQSLADIGIRATYETYSDDELLTVIQDVWPTGRYPIAAAGFLPYDPVGLLYWIEHFYGGYGDPEPEGYVDVIRNGSPEESAQALEDLGRYIVDEAWIVPISSAPAIYASEPDVEFEVLPEIPQPLLWDFRPAD